MEFPMQSLLNAFVYWINSQMSSLRDLWINSKRQDIFNTILYWTVEPNKVSQVLEKRYSVCMACTGCGMHGLRFGVTRDKPEDVCAGRRLQLCDETDFFLLVS